VCRLLEVIFLVVANHFHLMVIEACVSYGLVESFNCILFGCVIWDCQVCVMFGGCCVATSMAGWDKVCDCIHLAVHVCLVALPFACECT